MNDSHTSRQTITIKKYANRRLYNTATSSYVTLEDLSAMVKEGVEFCVYDAKTSEDITRSVLTQIIVEEESKSGQQNLLPIGFLRNLIGFYGDNMQWMVPKYLEHSMDLFSNNQDQIKSYFQSTFGSIFPFGTTFEEVGKQNLAMFERAMRLFNPLDGDANVEANTSVSSEKFHTSPSSCCSTKSSNVTNMTPRATTDTTSSASTSSSAPAPSSAPASSSPSATSSSTISAPSTMSAPSTCCSTSSKKDDSSCCSTSKDTAPASCCCSAPTPSISIASTEAAPSVVSTTSASTPSDATPMPMTNVKNATASTSSDADDMQQKIANLQRQLADLAKNRA